VRFTRAIDDFILDRRGQGKINSAGTEAAYRAALLRLAEDCGHKDPREVTRNDVKRTLRRWSHPNTLFARRSFMVAFFDWMEQEGYRKDNPARQTPSPRRRKPQRYRLTRDEVHAIRSSYITERERWLGDLGLLAGLRLAELQGLKGSHFQREDGRFVWVSADIAKGGKQRYVPVVPDLMPVVDEIRARVPLDGYVFPALRWADPGVNSRRLYMDKPTDSKTLWRTVQTIGRRAGISGSIAPHTLRHAFADYIAKTAGVQAAVRCSATRTSRPPSSTWGSCIRRSCVTSSSGR
jgi:integrase/recombinase XerD